MSRISEAAVAAADGILSSSLSSDAIIQSLRLVHLGSHVVSPHLTDLSRSNPKRCANCPAALTFSPTPYGSPCPAVALRAFDRGEAGHHVQRQGDLDRPVGGEDRAVVGQPLHGMWRPDGPEALLDAADHHVPDHLAGDAGGGGDPADHLAVMAVEGEGNAYHLAVLAVNSSASEHQR
jgi:hypothetical protein